MKKWGIMLTYPLEDRENEALYVYLYRCIKRDISTGRIAPGQRLPSKRSFAAHLGVSLVTVEAAYTQLIAEGYVRSEARRGYFANAMPATLASRTPAPQAHAHAASANQAAPAAPANSAALPSPTRPVPPTWPTAPATPVALTAAQLAQPVRPAAAPPESTSSCAPAADLTKSTLPLDLFPFPTWSKIMRETLAREPRKAFVEECGVLGTQELREAIAAHLSATRGFHADPACIVVGAGAQVLYNMLVQLLGNARTVGVEDPGYARLTRIYELNGMPVRHLPLDESGLGIEAVRASDASLLHIMPSHQFPTGCVMPVTRRYELLAWANEQEGRYLIEDDYDCEFRLAGRPIPTLASMDAAGRVIYANTFSRSLGAAFRIAYLVLPPHLAHAFQEKLGFYSCTVSAAEQLALARFIREGHFERHIRRVKTHCRSVRDALIEGIQSSAPQGSYRIERADSGLHFLMAAQEKASRYPKNSSIAEKVAQELAARNIAINHLENFCLDSTCASLQNIQNRLAVFYASLPLEQAREIGSALGNALASTQNLQ